MSAASSRLPVLACCTCCPTRRTLNPIELCWSKLKALLKEFGAQTHDALDDAIRRAMDLIDGSDAAACFAHCGYSGHLK
jgi:hypothetical protein